jgi:hypothetical protein
LVAWQRAVELAGRVDALLEGTALGRHRALADQMSRGLDIHCFQYCGGV